MTPWLPKATVAVEDRRFYQHGGVDYVGIARAAWKDVTRREGRRGRLDDHAAARAQPLHGQREDVQPQAQGGVPRDQARAQAGRSDRILDEYLNTVYYGNHAYGVEAAAQTYFSKHAKDLTLLAGGAARRAAAGAVGLRPVPQPEGGARAPRRGAARDARSNGAITPPQYRQRDQAERARLKPGRIYTRIKQPYFFSYVIDELERAVRREHRARGRAARSTRRSTRGCSATRSRRSATSCRTAPIRPRRSSRSSRAPARSAR